MTELAVVIGMILFPGIIATIIADKIIVHVKPWGSLKYGLYSFVLGILCYFGLQCIAWFQMMLPESYQTIESINSPLDVWSIIADSKSRIYLREVIIATLLSGPIAFSTAFLINHKTFHKLTQRLRVSSKYGDESLYSFYLNTKEVNWIYVRDIERKLTYQGIIHSFSDNDTVQELVLYNVYLS